MDREKLKELLLLSFLKSLFETLKPFLTVEEKVDYLETLITYLQGVYWHEEAIPQLGIEGNVFDSSTFIRKNVFLKYKDKAKPFVDTHLRFYLEKEPNLRSHLFKLLQINEPILDEIEFEQYNDSIYSLLHNLIEKICTQSFESAKKQTEEDVKNIKQANKESTTTFKATNSEYTRPRQALMLHYLFEAMGLNKDILSRRKLAEFAHALVCWPIDKIDNSGLYKMLKEAPLLKDNDENMLKDLKFIKAQFELVNIPGTIELVEKEIRSIKNS